MWGDGWLAFQNTHSNLTNIFQTIEILHFVWKHVSSLYHCTVFKCTEDATGQTASVSARGAGTEIWTGGQRSGVRRARPTLVLHQRIWIYTYQQLVHPKSCTSEYQFEDLIIYNLSTAIVKLSRVNLHIQCIISNSMQSYNNNWYMINTFEHQIF